MNQGVIATGNHLILDSLRGAPPRRPAWTITQAKERDHLQVCMSSRGRQAAAISWDGVQIRTAQQEIATPRDPQGAYSEQPPQAALGES